MPMSDSIEGLVQGYESGRITRRELILMLGALVATPGMARAQPARNLRPVRSLNHATLFVSDVERSVGFYQRLFDLPVQSRQGTGVNLSTGEGPQFLGIFDARGAAPHIHHVCLGIEGFDAEAAVDALSEYGVEGRIRMRGEVPELYFTDPDGISVQLQDVSYCGGGGALGSECLSY
jgi:catechol 2,3-dioxygenase-like lactoylglutathione lyase family enzyme